MKISIQKILIQNNFLVYIVFIAVVSSLISCSPDNFEEVSSQRFIDWYHGFQTEREIATNLDDYIDSYEATWTGFELAPPLPMNNAAGPVEFQIALDWFNKKLGLPENIRVIDFIYHKMAWGSGIKNLYIFEVQISREKAVTHEDYVVRDENGHFKLLRIDFIDYEMK